MQVQVNTDRNIEGHAELVRQVESVIRGALERFADQIMRVEAHLSDENSAHKAGADDKRCLLEARLAGRPPVAVSHNAATIEEAAGGAAGKLERSLASSLGRLADR